MSTTDARSDAAFMLGVRIGGYLFEHFCSEYDFTFAGEKYELVSDEDLTVLGYTGDTSDLLILRHTASGACFEVDLEAFARPVPTREESARQAQIAAQSERIIAGWSGKGGAA
jgi:hypothetical protein